MFDPLLVPRAWADVDLADAFDEDLVEPAAPGGGIVGDGAVTLGALTIAAAGTVPVVGASAMTLGALTTAAAGTVAVRGASALTLSALTVTSAGVVPVTGASSLTLDALTLTSAGTVAVRGASALTLADLTLSSTGTVGSTAVSGEAALTLAALTLAASGGVAVAGVGALTLDVLTLTSAGVVPGAGASSLILDGLTLTAAGAVAVSGTAALSLDALTLAADGTAPLQPIAGASSLTLGTLFVTSAGRVHARPVTTAADILARVRTVVGSLGLRVHRGEQDFRGWCERNPTAALRRFEARMDLIAYEPTGTWQLDEQRLSFTLTVAYPHGNRHGRTASLGRDDVQRIDRLAIERAIGLIDLTNFAGGLTPRAKWTGSSATRERGAGVDFLVIRQTFDFYRSQP